VRLPLEGLTESFQRAQQGKRSRHEPTDRVRPSLAQYDYLALSSLSADVSDLLQGLGPASPGARALDLGADRSPYRELLETLGYAVETLDIGEESGADHIGPADRTGLPDSTFDLVLCTQVLEHVARPLDVLREVRRILTPRGMFLFSVPHVWFFHPHPADYWRFTQQGVLELCTQGGFHASELRGQGGTLLSLAQIVNFTAYGLLGRAGAPLFAAVNVIGERLDRLVANPLFCHNFVCLARPAPR
jgi:SAM-dependent methyltransferase